MGVAAVRDFFASRAPDVEIIEQAASVTTAIEAAKTLGVGAEQIAKTIALRTGDRVILVVASGTSRIDNRKVKDRFGVRPRILPADEAERLTGHPVGGVCPFGLATPIAVFCDASLLRFVEVFPAAGSRTASARLSPERLAALADAEWVDVCA
ncbi:YbaK/EbsC family protein [Sphingomonas sp. TF3]|uniref:YbaK/EbsC family protein n=1 Tax=Sphingomonas sp. TF3 TaxID=2495580 RepID=UPI000F8768D7|nr:YbaK/EbsC family protein [Sphingomonas sp. TF3]RUN76490.1 YbaK/EbsC family protein [Sphingomonas sp. TF3]